MALQPLNTMTMIVEDYPEGILQELTTFSTLDFFGHLFDPHRVLETGIKKAESSCQLILHHQLRNRIEHSRMASEMPDLQSALSELEQTLSTFFNTHSPFWERYYARQQSITQNTAHIPDPKPMTVADILLAARKQFPHFYTVLDALYFGTRQHQSAYSLIELSLQEYLKACLLAEDLPEEARHAFIQALRLLGPLNAPGYRRLLESKLEV